ncbi:F0F1 ATP synthase subunit A [Candidatus Uhrbacteria bacterium]|jgi:F-type H+-transporting ATPase subunit a|nr:F0F1 ATP synthase subunit A [Candidatus Uhrbacteria bacterium]
MSDITLPARIIFSLGPVPVTDGFLGAVLVSVTIIGLFIYATRSFGLVPTRLQMVLEMISDYIMEQLKTAFHSTERAEAFFPFFMTMLLFIFVANQFMFVPFIFELTYNGFDIFRQPTSDFAQPIALSLMVFFISQWMAFKISPLNHIQNFISVKPFLKARSLMEFFTASIEAFVGLLNIVGEFAKIVSLAARLFGNVFAGNVMVAVIIGLGAYTQFIVPIPFLILSVFSGLVQAFVFMLLSVQFVAISIDGAMDDEEEEIVGKAVATT